MGFKTGDDLAKFGKLLGKTAKTVDGILSDIMKWSEKWRKQIDGLAAELYEDADLGEKSKKEIDALKKEIPTFEDEPPFYVPVIQQAHEALLAVSGLTPPSELLDEYRDMLSELVKVAKKLDEKSVANYKKAIDKKFKKAKVTEVKKGDDVVLGYRRATVTKVVTFKRVESHYDSVSNTRALVNVEETFVTVEFADGTKKSLSKGSLLLRQQVRSIA